jgi:hypothetical protein
MPFRVRLWRYTGISDPRNITLAAGFSKSLVYAATHSALATNYSRGTISAAGILPGVLMGGVGRQV